jgi:hypothetical protein
LTYREKIDPERPTQLQHIWRKIHCQTYCAYVGSSRSEWFFDVGYCLDRYSLIDSKGGRYD